MDVNQQALEKFGQHLIEEVRDASISWADRLLDGQWKAPFLKELHKKIAASLNEEQLGVVRYLIPMIVDQVLFEFLVKCEEEDWFDISVKTDSGVLPTLREGVEGLHYEIYDWIREYSKQRHNYLDDRDEFST